MSESQTINAQQLSDHNFSGTCMLIDVRTPLEFSAVHATDARNVPLDQLDPCAIMKDRDCTAENPVYVICKAGSRGAKAQKKFIEAGYTHVINVEGGTDAWVSAGLPVVRGKKVMSLERQVRIAAGFLVFTGAVLSFWNIYFACLSGFVGAGLMFAGITDTCGMGLMLAKMPWNQKAACSDSTATCQTKGV